MKNTSAAVAKNATAYTEGKRNIEHDVHHNNLDPMLPIG